MLAPALSPPGPDSSSDSEASGPHLSQERKKRKPLMEKKRRARINASLDALKRLVLDAMKKDSARYSKLEKADILELTVRHLRDSQQRQAAAATVALVDPGAGSRYRRGFAECAAEVNRYLSTDTGASLAPDAARRLMQHLAGCLHKAEITSQYQPLSVHQPLQPQQQQPLQIQIPLSVAGTSLSSLPGSTPPTPPSPDHHLPHAAAGQFYSLLPALTQQQVSQCAPAPPAHAAPLRSSENLGACFGGKAASSSSPHVECHRYAPYGGAATRRQADYSHVQVKQEDMWRPW